MVATVGLRDGFTATELRWLAESRRDAGQVGRLLALAVTSPPFSWSGLNESFPAV